MNAKSLTACAILPTFILGSFLTTAAASPRDVSSRVEDTSARGDDHSMTTERPPQRPAAPVSFDLDLAWYHHEPDGEYDVGILLNGDLFNVQIEGEKTQGSLSIYDAEGDLVVGYVAGRSSIVLFDSAGLVERNEGEALTTSIGEFGLAAAVLADPMFVLEFAQASGAVLGDGDDEDPPGYWWVVTLFILRCIDAELEFNGDGEVTGGSVAWDC